MERERARVRESEMELETLRVDTLLLLKPCNGRSILSEWSWETSHSTELRVQKNKNRKKAKRMVTNYSLNSLA